jgi:hypothetical protein
LEKEKELGDTKTFNFIVYKKLMRKLLTILSILVFATSANSQRLSQISFQNGANLSYFSFLVDQEVLLRVSVDGKILEWGTELLSERGNFYAPKLQPYLGRVEYYGPEVDSVFRGKVKSIGTCYITYYGGYEETGKRGKIKTLGTLAFDYYSVYDDKSLQGKIKLLGNLPVEFYRPYENEAYRGKLKSIGNLPITYYSVFDDKYNAGKLKSVGSLSYAWYSEYDRAKGALRSNNYRALVDGITIVLR